MTFIANRNDVKMMLRFITSKMMIKRCGIMAISAFICICFREFSTMNKTIYSIFSRKPIGPSATMNKETPFSLFLSIIDFCINSEALFTFSKVAIFHSSIFVKFRNWFGLLASIASFLYDLLSHNQLLCSWLRLEPVTDYTSVSGSLYYNPSIQNNQTIITKFSATTPLRSGRPFLFEVNE